MYEGKYLVVGPPGTGKTHWLKVQVEKVVHDYQSSMLVNWQHAAMVCSLTRAAAAEVASRVVLEKGAVGTLHSHCYAGIGRPRLVNQEHVAEWNTVSRFELRVSDFVKPPKKSATSMENKIEFHEEESSTPAYWESSGASEGQRDVFQAAERLRHMLIPTEQWPPAVKDFHEEWTEFKRQEELVDFTDMIEQALLTVSVAPGNPWVILVDEAQDLSKLERDLILKWGERAGAVMLVGDPLQTLYAFRGSDPYFFEDSDVPSEKKKVLAQSYRVPRKVLEASRYWVSMQLPDFPQAEYKPKVVFGEVYEGDVRVGEHTWKDPAPLTEEIEGVLRKSHDETVMVQATCGFMLGRIIRDFKEWGIPFSNPWRRTYGYWNPFRGKGMHWRVSRLLSVCKDTTDLKPWTYVQIGEFCKSLKSKGVFRRGWKTRVLELAKQYESHPDSTPEAYELDEWFGEESFLKRAWLGEFTELEVMEWWFKNRSSSTSESLASYLYRIVERFGAEAIREEPRVFVGTIHSFKGAEADHVYVFPDLPPVAFEAWKQQYGSQFEEVVRAFYVAMTRSKERLTICRPSSIKCAPLKRTVGEYLNGQRSGDVVR